MKVLMISPFELFPTKAGNQKNTYELCKHLISEGFSVGYIYLNYGNEKNTSSISEDMFLEYRGISGSIGSNNVILNILKKILNNTFEKLTNIFFKPIFLFSKQDLKIINNSLNQQNYDVIIIHHYVLGSLIKKINLKHRKSIIFTHDLQFMRLKSLNAIKFFEEKFLNINKKLELSTYIKFDYTLVVSKLEYDVLKDNFFPNEKIILSGSAHETMHPKKLSKKWDLLYVGASGNKPNIEGLTYFLKNIWPQLKLLKPDIKIAVAGSIGQDIQYKCKNDKNILILGYIEDLTKVYAKTKIVIAPLYTGSGIKGKVLEGISNSKVVVTTSTGIEGMEKTVRDCCLVYDETNDWIKSIMSMLKSEEKRKKIEKNAKIWSKKFLTNKYVWKDLILKIIS